jgi:hypothetical protein
MKILYRYSKNQPLQEGLFTVENRETLAPRLYGYTRAAVECDVAHWQTVEHVAHHLAHSAVSYKSVKERGRGRVKGRGDKKRINNQCWYRDNYIRVSAYSDW